MPNGWIKLHRKLLDWEWFDEPNTFRVFIYLILMANHQPTIYRGIKLKRGQLLTSQLHLGKRLKLSRQKIRTSLKNLSSTNEITIHSTNNYSIVSILNWDRYQIKDNQPDNHPANKRATIYKNDKEIKNIYTKNSFNKNITEPKPMVETWNYDWDKAVKDKLKK